MPSVDFQILRDEITMNEVLDQLGFQPTSRTGNQLRGPCPVHRAMSAQSRSFSVNLETARYYCHQCNSHGHPLELWSAVKQLTIYEAAIDLCQTLGKEVPWINRW